MYLENGPDFQQIRSTIDGAPRVNPWSPLHDPPSLKATAGVTEGDGREKKGFYRIYKKDDKSRIFFHHRVHRGHREFGGHDSRVTPAA